MLVVSLCWRAKTECKHVKSMLLLTCFELNHTTYNRMALYSALSIGHQSAFVLHCDPVIFDAAITERSQTSLLLPVHA